MSIRWHAAWAVLLAATAAMAQVPIEHTRFVYVGSLSDSQTIVTTGNYDFIARLYDSPQNGNQVAPEFDAPSTLVVAGQFSIELDFAYGVLSPESWLELSLRPSGTPMYETLSPRQRIDHVPIALYAQYGLNAAHVPWSGITGIPPQLADGTDADTLGSLGCSAAQIPVAGAAGTWSCADAPTNGLSILHGSGVPDAALGRIGEFYLDTANAALYGPKTGTGWGAAVSLIGPSGSGGGTTPPDVPIGTMTLEPGLTGTGITVLSLRQLSMGISDSSAHSGVPPSLSGLQVEVAASDVLPLLFENMATSTRPFNRSRIDLVVTGTETKAFLDLQEVELIGMDFNTEPTLAPWASLTFRFRSITINSSTASASYDAARNIASLSFASFCSSLLGSIGQGTPPPGFTGSTPNVSQVLGLQYFEGTRPGPDFSDSSLSFSMPGSNPMAARNLALCGFGFTARESIFNSNWSFYTPGAAAVGDWRERVDWTSVWGSNFRLSVSTPDSLALTFALYPAGKIRVSTPAYTSCWDQVARAECP